MFLKRFLLISLTILLSSCESNNTDTEGSTETVDSQVNDFIYKGLSTYYLYKDEQPYFQLSSKSLNYGSPESFFERLIVEEDRFSFIVDDYEDLINSFAGRSLTDGIDFGLSRLEEGSDDLIGYVNYVANDSPADLAGVLRGDVFTSINGINMTISNYIELLNLDEYTIELKTFDNASNELITRDNIQIFKEEFTESPIHINKIIELDGLKIGYLMYNSFISGSENELNVVFNDFKASGINELILDLRYNGGGRISTAVDLCGMITGQFNDEILISEQWNSERQAEIEDDNPEFLFSRFRDVLTDGETPLNSLGLTKLYIISSKNRTASSSELVINGLDAYIDVIHVGDIDGTVGKSQASVTLYDSDVLFNQEGISDAHKYAIQPLIYTSANKDGFVVPNEGLTPDTFISEDVTNLGVLGEVNEVLLQTALNSITGSNLSAKKLQEKHFGNYVGNSKENSNTYQKMY